MESNPVLVPSGAYSESQAAAPSVSQSYLVLPPGFTGAFDPNVLIGAGYGHQVLLKTMVQNKFKLKSTPLIKPQLEKNSASQLHSIKIHRGFVYLII